MNQKSLSNKLFSSIQSNLFSKCTRKTVSLNQRNISLIYGQRKHFFELKKVLLIQKKFLWSKEIVLFTLKKMFLNQQNFLQFKEIFSFTVYQRNVSLIQKNCFLGDVEVFYIYGVIYIFRWHKSNTWKHILKTIVTSFFCYFKKTVQLN